MKVEKSVELESYNWTNLRIKVWQSIDLDQSNTSSKTYWTSFATNVQNLQEGNSQKIHICSSCPYETPYKRYLIKHVKTQDT